MTLVSPLTLDHPLPPGLLRGKGYGLCPPMDADAMQHHRCRLSHLLLLNCRTCSRSWPIGCQTQYRLLAMHVVHEMFNKSLLARRSALHSPEPATGSYDAWRAPAHPSPQDAQELPGHGQGMQVAPSLAFMPLLCPVHTSLALCDMQAIACCGRAVSCGYLDGSKQR